MTAEPTPAHRRRAPGRHLLAPVAALVVVIAVVVPLLVVHDGGSGSSASSPGAQGSGVAASQARALPSFEAVELSGSNNLAIRIGAKQTVVVRADDNLLTRVTTEVHDGTLVVGNTKGSFTTKAPMKVEITVPSVESLRLSGSGTITTDGIEAKRLSLSLTGSGVVRASGRVADLGVVLAGSGDVMLERLIARDAVVVLAGSGRVHVTTTKSIDASVPGIGTIVYGGSPADVTTDVAGVGTIVAGV